MVQRGRLDPNCGSHVGRATLYYRPKTLYFSVIPLMGKNYICITHLGLLKIKYGPFLTIQESTSIYLSIVYNLDCS